MFYNKSAYAITCIGEQSMLRQTCVTVQFRQCLNYSAFIKLEIKIQTEDEVSSPTR